MKEECLSKLLLFGEGALQRVVTEFIEHFLAERNHQDEGNVLLFPSRNEQQRSAGMLAYSAARALAVYSSTTIHEQHEYLCHTGSSCVGDRQGLHAAIPLRYGPVSVSSSRVHALALRSDIAYETLIRKALNHVLYL